MNNPPLYFAHQRVVSLPSHQQVQVTIATVSLGRKNALPLAQRATRRSGGQQHRPLRYATLTDSTNAQNEKFEALDCTNSTAGETCFVGCALGYELVSGDSLRTLTCVSENESVVCLTGSLPARRVTARTVKISHTAPLVKQLVQSALSLPTTLSPPASPWANWKVTLCRLISCARKRSVLTWPLVTRLRWRQIARTGPLVTRAK